MAYKSIDAVMEAQKDLVEIVHTLRQVVCVRGKPLPRICADKALKHS